MKKKVLRGNDRVSRHDVDVAANKWCHVLVLVMKGLVRSVDKAVIGTTYDDNQTATKVDQVLESASLCQSKLESVIGLENGYLKENKPDLTRDDISSPIFLGCCAIPTLSIRNRPDLTAMRRQVCPVLSRSLGLSGRRD